MKTTAPLLAMLAALALLPAATAHVTVQSVAPTEPVAPGQTVDVEVTLIANCAVVAAEYAQNPELQLALVPTADGVEPPAYLPFVGETVPFTVDMCDPTDLGSPPSLIGPLVRSTGVLRITPSPLAPAFQAVPLQPGAVGETNQGGNFTLTIAYSANLTASPDQAVLVPGKAGVVVLDLTANADTLVRIGRMEEGTTGNMSGHQGHGSGKVQVPQTLSVDSPLLAGSATRRIEIPVTLPEHHEGDLRLMLTPEAAADGALVGPTLHLVVPVAPALHDNGTDHGDMDDHAHDEEEAPLPALLAVLAVALAAVRRRQA